MIVPFPHRYTASLARTDRSRARLEAPPRRPLDGGPPPEFGGEASTWSPEHLLLSAIELCLFTTFEALAARTTLAVENWNSAITGTVDRTATGLAFTSFTLEVRLTVAESDLERARALLDRAHQQCLVSRALRLHVEIQATVAASSAAA
jgi:organic hydroperoxide reductase OsmC/OhrA